MHSWFAMAFTGVVSNSCQHSRMLIGQVDGGWSAAHSKGCGIVPGHVKGRSKIPPQSSFSAALATMPQRQVMQTLSQPFLGHAQSTKYWDPTTTRYRKCIAHPVIDVTYRRHYNPLSLQRSLLNSDFIWTATIRLPVQNATDSWMHSISITHSGPQTPLQLPCRHPSAGWPGSPLH